MIKEDPAVETTKLLDKLKSLLVFGSNLICENPPVLSKIRLKKRLFLSMMVAVQSYTECILKIVTSPNVYVDAAEALYRAVLETQININYISYPRDMSNARIFMIDFFRQKISFANKQKDLMNKYPKWGLTFNKRIKSTQDWDDFIVENEKYIEKYGKAYNQVFPTKLPILVQRAQEVDKYVKSKTTLSSNNSLEYNYATYYGYFSQLVHLDPSGLEKRLHFDAEGGLVMSFDSHPDDIVPIVSVVYQSYYGILKFYAKQFKIYNKDEFKPHILVLKDTKDV